MSDESNESKVPKDDKGELIEVRRVKSQNRIMVYTNNTMVFSSPYDFQFYFSVINEARPGEFEATEQAVVVMTPEHAVRLYNALGRNLQIYQNKHGKIREPEGPVSAPPNVVG